MRTLGRTGLKVSVIGLGTIWVGRKEWGVKPADQRRLPTKREVHSFLSQAANMGINFVDTAPAYGVSEQILGEIFRENPVLRQKFFLATKCGSYYDFQTQADIKDFSFEGIRKSIEESLRRLGSPIDLMQIHSATMEVVERGEALEAMKQFQERGDLRFLGITCSDKAEVLEKAIQSGEYDTIQAPFNILYTPMERAFSLAKSAGLGVIANRPLASGLLSPSYVFAGEEEREKIRQVLASLPSSVDLIRAAMQFVLFNKHISIILVGTSKIDRLKSILEVV